MILQIIFLILLGLIPIGFILYNIYLEKDIIKAFKKVISDKSKKTPEYITIYYNYHKENIKTYIFILVMFVINILILVWFFS